MGLRIAFVTCLVLLAVHANCSFSTVGTLDDFAVGQPMLFVAVDGSDFPQRTSSAVTGAVILGGERDIGISVDASPPGVVFSAGVFAGGLSYSGGSGATADIVLQYDGLDGVMQFGAPTANGLDSFDATLDGAATGIRLVIASDIATSVTVSIYDADGRVSELTRPVTSFSLESVYFSYSTFRGTADMTDVGAIEFLMSGEGIDTLIDSIDFVNSPSSSSSSGSSPSSSSPSSALPQDE